MYGLYIKIEKKLILVIKIQGTVLNNIFDWMYDDDVVLFIIIYFAPAASYCITTFYLLSVFVVDRCNLSKSRRGLYK